MTLFPTSISIFHIYLGMLDIFSLLGFFSLGMDLEISPILLSKQ